MSPSRYLPSKQFSLIAISLFLSAGLVFAADSVTKPAKGTLAVDTTSGSASTNTDWQSSLQTVQDQSGISLPSQPDQNTVDGLLQAARSNNITDTISRSLLVNLMDAKAQGLGDDIPTQDQIVKSALSQVPTTSAPKQAKQEDLTIVNSSTQSLHTYGNTMMDLLIKDSDQEYAKTMVIIDDASSSNDPAEFSKFKDLQKKYQTVAQDLVEVPVPKTLEPFHLALINDYFKLAATYDGMATLISDPIGGLGAVQQYNSLTQSTFQMFINIAQALNKNDILFDKNEPGAAWATLLQAQQQNIQ